MYRMEYRKPGCLLGGIFFIVAFSLSSIPGELFRSLVPSWGHWPYLAFIVLLIWLQAGLFQWVTRRRVPVCPHCGVATDMTFRVCRSCGRVK
jgi:hypothetical protein